MPPDHTSPVNSQTVGIIAVLCCDRGKLDPLLDLCLTYGMALWNLYRRGSDTHNILSVDEFYWADRPRYYAELDAVRRAGDDLTSWLEYSAEGLRNTLERVWLRVQTFQPDRGKKIVLRPKQEQLLRLLADHGSMAPSEIWDALDISKQRAMDLINPLIEAGMIERTGGKKTGRYSLRKP